MQPAIHHEGPDRESELDEFGIGKVLVHLSHEPLLDGGVGQCKARGEV